MENTGNQSIPFSPCPPAVITYTLYIPRNIYSNSFIMVFIVINAALALISSCINFLVIHTIARTRPIQVPSNILVLGLAMSDFGVGIIAQTAYCVYKFFEMKRSVSLYCTVGLIFNYSSWTLAIVSLLTLTEVTGDRFLAVNLHLRYQEIATPKRYCILLGLIWVASLVICICRMKLGHLSGTRLIGFLSFIFLITINLVFLIKIFKVIRRHSLQIHAQQQSVQQSIDMPRYKKSVNTMYYVIGAFLVCYLPFAGTMAVHTNTGKRMTQYDLIFQVVTETLVMFNGVLNPIIYCWRMQEIRHSAIQLFRRSFRTS